MSRTDAIDNEAIRQLRDELKDLNESIKKSSKITEKFTVAMFLLAMIQILLAIFQLVLSFVYPNNPVAKTWLGVAMALGALISLVYFFNLLSKKIK